jgi:hypothetical protein
MSKAYHAPADASVTPNASRGTCRRKRGGDDTRCHRHHPRASRRNRAISQRLYTRIKEDKTAIAGAFNHARRPPASFRRPQSQPLNRRGPGRRGRRLRPRPEPLRNAWNGRCDILSRRVEKIGKSDSGNGQRLGSGRGCSGSDRRYHNGRGDERAGAHADR